MASEIIQSLTQEEKKDLLSFTSFEEIVAAVIIGIVSLIIMLRLPFGFAANITIALSIFISVFFIYRYYAQNYFKLLIYKQSYKNVSFFDKRMENFLNIQAIRGNTIIFNDNTMMAILRIKPIDGSLLDEDELHTALAAYDAALKSISQTIHIFSHSVLPNYDDFFEHIEEKIIQQGGDYDSMLKMSRSKQKWLVEKMKETHSRDRLNYFAIHFRKKGFKASFRDSLLFLFGMKKYEEVRSVAINEELLDKIIAELFDVVNTASVQLKKTNIEAIQLKDDELMNLFSSYFLNIRGVGKSNLSPIMWQEE